MGNKQERNNGDGRRTGLELPVLKSRAQSPRNYGRWRAVSLSIVYLLMVAHIVHWKLAGRTLAPLEFNEVLHTLELGIVTVGFLFMCVTVLSTLILGRFFCSWGCHILALQDLCAWLLQQVRIRPKPIRSRVLLCVPALTAFYLFLWPQALRLFQGHPLPKLHLATDTDGWASIVTDDFWRNLPGPWIVALTFLVCGFLTVYVLGSRSFCTYVCPYGVVFGLADRLAIGRIRVDDSCEQCGQCTAACNNHIRVHEEVALHGMVVNPACMKDLDCVAACPKNALRFGIGRPALLKSYKLGRFGLPFDFSFAEELLIAGVMIAVLLTFTALYGVTPFFLALALGGIIGYASVVFLRLLRAPFVRLGIVKLKSHGRIGKSGYAFIAVFACIVLFTGHSAFIRYHEYSGNKKNQPPAAAYHHLALTQRWGIFENEMTLRGTIDALFRLGRYKEAESRLLHLLARHPANAVLRVRLAECLLKQGRTAEGEEQFRAITDQGTRDPKTNTTAVASAHQWLGNTLARKGRFNEAITELRHAIRLDPNRTAAHDALDTILTHLRRIKQATPHRARMLDAQPKDER